MPIELHPREALINAALMTKRPVAFLVGSPLSLKDGAGVPGTTTMLDLVRAEIRDRGSFGLPQFESALVGKTGAAAYQAAMKWLGVNAGQDAINDVITKAVLQARKPGAGACPPDSDGIPEDWNIPSGTASLADLVTRGGDRFLGPILTTNFDPLISLAIRNSGGRSGRRILAADGALGGAAEDERGVCSVIHLHGFWRGYDTLHTQAQLTNPRPKLKASLQRLLVVQRRTLIVAAYGAWDDVFTQALVELMNDEQAQLDIIWCFHENDPGQVERRYGKLLHEMNSAIVSTRFRLFGGIDCHSIFAEILTTLREQSSPAVVASSDSSPIAGWERIDSTYLNSLPDLSPDEIVRYFDGAVPSWRHAMSSAIPRRQVVAEVTKSLASIAKEDTARSMHLIRAAGGEGKSTLLMQVASDIAREGSWSVVWRSSPHAGISPEQLANLSAAQRWLIVSDEADTIVSGLANSAHHLSQLGRTGIHFLLAARDTDWRSAPGSKKPWEAWLTHFPDIILRGISPEDAKAVVTAWEQLGSDGLRELSFLGDTAERIAAFESAVGDAKNDLEEQQNRHLPQDGSFFGGLLAVRFGRNSLQAHVREFLHRLQSVKIEQGKSNLFEALLYVAACHGVGVAGVDERVLADLVSAPREWVQRLVVRPLGEEAAAVHNAGHVLTRHSKVAAAIMVEAEQTFGIDLAEVWAQLVRQTVHTGREIRMVKSWYSDIVHAGPRLQRALPQQIPEHRRKAIAIATAKADVVVESNRLCALTDLGRTYRRAEMIDQAVATFRDNLENAKSKIDFESDIRGYWYEWGVCEGIAGNTPEHRAADAWIQGLSISDYLPVPITLSNGKLVCAGLGVAFGKLAHVGADSSYAHALRAVAYIGRLTNPDRKTAGYFDRSDEEAEKLNTPRPRDVHEAIAWLTAAVAQAGRELQDSFLKSLIEPDRVSFNMFENILSPNSTPTERTLTFVKTTEPSVATNSGAELLKRFLPLEDPIHVGVERVIKEAWNAVPQGTAPQERFFLAIKKAKQSISRLSPQIKRQVGAHFETKGWEPLKTREPKP